MREIETYELIEIDPATGEEDQLISTGSFEKMSWHMQGIIEEVSLQLDEDVEITWPWLMIQPAA